jgi:hypothetical protein
MKVIENLCDYLFDLRNNDKIVNKKKLNTNRL